MRVRSLRTRIALIFGVAVGVIIALLYTIYNLQHQTLTDKVRENQLNAISWLNSLYEKSQNLPNNWEEYFQKFNLEYVHRQETRYKILKYADIIERYDTKLGKVEVLQFGNEYYLKLRQNAAVILLKNTLRDRATLPLLLCLLGCLVVFGVLFFSVLKSLEPLNVLREDIAKFASGNFNESCKIFTMNRKDEIGQVADEFYTAACKIKSLVESRQLFLRAIMHELKTPIGKGRILSESLEDGLTKERMVRVFERLNELINEFAKIEKIASGSYLLNLQPMSAEALAEEIKNAMMLENFDAKVALNFEGVDGDETLSKAVDRDLFILAVKNLLDNALKYSANGCAQMCISADHISVKNCGEPLKMDFSKYKEPFVREKSGKQCGMGLGLYIADKVCELHGFNLRYAYESGKHAITIEMSKKSKTKGESDENRKV